MPTPTTPLKLSPEDAEAFSMTFLDSFDDKRWLAMLPEPGERNPWGYLIWLGYGEGDDGGGAALAAYQYGRCPFMGAA